MKHLFYLIMLIVITSCANNPTEIGQNYTLNEHDIEYHWEIEGVSNIVRYNRTILLLSNNKVLGFDVDSSELKEYDAGLDTIEAIFSLQDTLLFISHDRSYSIKSLEGTNLTLQDYEYPNKDALNGPSFLTKEFAITSCCEGEWGGTIFLEEVCTHKVYSTAVSCLMNVDTFENEVYVFKYLKHFVTSFAVGKLGDIRSLYEINQEYNCNWYTSLPGDNFAYYDSLLIGNREANILLFDTTGMTVIHGFIDNGEIKLINLDEDKLNLLTVLSTDTLEVSATLITSEKNQPLHFVVGRLKDNVTISCGVPTVGVRDQNPNRLTHIVNVNKRDRTIDIYRLN